MRQQEAPTRLLSLMMKVCFFVLGLLGLSGGAHAAVVVVPSLTTSGDRSNAPAPRVVSAAETTVNLEDRAGLTPGESIQITVTTTSPVVWTGAFVYGQQGDLTFSIQGTLSLVVGGDAAGTTARFGNTYTGPREGSSASGYQIGPLLPELTLIVPWETDLSAVVLGLAQDTILTGGGAALTSSSLTIAEGKDSTLLGSIHLRLQSIPEPSVVLLAALAVGGAGGRRRRAQVDLPRRLPDRLRLNGLRRSPLRFGSPD